VKVRTSDLGPLEFKTGQGVLLKTTYDGKEIYLKKGEILLLADCGEDFILSKEEVTNLRTALDEILKEV
jgi:hypothetical protein